MELHGSIGNSELAFDIALHDAGMFLVVDLAEDAPVDGLFRRLAVGRRPQVTFEDCLENLLAVHRVFRPGCFKDLDGGVEKRHALDGFIGFVGGVDDVLVFLILAAGHEFRSLVFRDDLDGGDFGRFGFLVSLGLFLCRFLLGGFLLGFILRLRAGGLFRIPVEFDPTLGYIEFLVVREAAYADSAVKDFEDLCVDKVAADFDADETSDLDLADAHG